MFSQRYIFVYPCVVLLLLLTNGSLATASSQKLSLLETISPHALIADESSAKTFADTGFRLAELNILEAQQIDTAPVTTTTAAPTVNSTVAETSGVLPLNDGSGNRTPDWNGVWLDTGIFLGAQFVATGVIFMMPESFSGWSSKQKQDTFSHYGDNFLHPVMDKDDFYINFVLHPYWGATYYTRGRERGLDPTSSFYYSFLMSALYEFGPECFFEKPSIQDLVITPGLGSLLGALVFEPWRNYIKGKEELRWYDHVSLVATDPLGLLSLGVEKMFGVKSTILVDYSPPKHLAKTSANPAGTPGSRMMITMQFPFN